MQCPMELEAQQDQTRSGMTRLRAHYSQVAASQEQYALILVNIKNFRYYNTKYGAAAGDELLDLVAQRIDTTLSEGELAARLYADNFAILLRYRDTNQLIYERMMELIDRVYRIEDDRIYRNLFISMGLYLVDNPQVPLEEALNFANLCRKECDTLHSRSSCLELYDLNFYKQYMDRMDLEAATADAYKNYEFDTYVQPKIDLKTGEIVGAEALLRWFDKDGNNIPLSEFLPILDRNRYIELIDLDTFEILCRHLEGRLKNGQRVVPISFNFSRSSFNDPNTLQNYTQVFEKFDIPGQLVEMEFMESISMDNTQQLQQMIDNFKNLGFSCSLDDFGNGYSSFGVLLSAKLDTVKLDRQFFVDELNDHMRRIIKTMVDLIHSMDLKIVAEGVESQEHIDYLKECGCDYVQGFYYYRPMPVDQFEALLDGR